jgi:uncharacterized protein (TIGR02611 family)
MLDKLKQSWRHLKEGKPGKRFRQQYERRKRSGRSNLSKILFIILGLLIMVVGLIFLPAPGPGTLILLPGAALIARESLFAARLLDWLEVRIRRVIARGLKFWENASLLVKALVVVLALAIVTALAFAAYRLFLH